MTYPENRENGATFWALNQPRPRIYEANASMASYSTGTSMMQTSIEYIILIRSFTVKLYWRRRLSIYSIYESISGTVDWSVLQTATVPTSIMLSNSIFSPLKRKGARIVSPTPPTTLPAAKKNQRLLRHRHRRLHRLHQRRRPLLVSWSHVRMLS